MRIITFLYQYNLKCPSNKIIFRSKILKADQPIYCNPFSAQKLQLFKLDAYDERETVVF